MSVLNAFFFHYYDIDKISKACRLHGILLFLDLAHAIGSVPLKIKEWDIDAAYFCSYKFLCGGPGAVGGLYIN
jgi:kynureninase